MKQARKRPRLAKVAASVAVGLVLAGGYLVRDSQAQGPVERFPGPTSSQPLALTIDGKMLAVVNPDNDTVSFFDVESDRNRKLGEIYVQSEPNGVVFHPNGRRAFVANTVSGTVSVLAVFRSGQVARAITHVKVGTEPYGLALTPNGNKLYVTNARSNSVTVLDANTYKVLKTIENVGFEPRGIAITNNGDDDDSDETVYVTQFLSLPVGGGKLDGEDDSKIGLVTAISTSDDSIKQTVFLRPLADTGFKAAGDAIARTAPPATPVEADFKFQTGAYPNQLNNIAIRGNFAYVPSTGASPNGPTRFDVNTQSLLSAINRATNQDAGRTINMHTAVRDQTVTPKLFITVPWAMAFKNRSDEGYVVSAASNIVVKLRVDPQTGAATVQQDPVDYLRVLQIRTGKNPRGIAINSADTRAYVMNYISRDVTPIDISGPVEKTLAGFRSTALPATGSLEDMIQVGKELYNASVGEFDPATPTGAAIAGRMSNNGWGSCAACHPNGLTDNVVWIFGAGPRRTVSQHTDFDLTDPNAQKALNWSGIFDEEADFELNIRGVSGGAGLFVGDDGVTAIPTAQITGFGTPNTPRRQLKVRGVNAWDAIKAYIQSGVRAPISPADRSDPDVIEGEDIFRQNNCQSCHGGPQWTVSRINPPAAAADITNGQLIAQLRKVGTFDATQKNEVRATAAAPLGADGFVPPSLLSLFAFPKTFFHNGSADTLEQVFDNVAHRTAGTSGVDLLDDIDKRRKLIKFLLSIDPATPPIY